MRKIRTTRRSGFVNIDSFLCRLTAFYVAYNGWRYSFGDRHVRAALHAEPVSPTVPHNHMNYGLMGTAGGTFTAINRHWWLFRRHAVTISSVYGGSSRADRQPAPSETSCSTPSFRICWWVGRSRRSRRVRIRADRFRGQRGAVAFQKVSLAPTYACGPSRLASPATTRERFRVVLSSIPSRPTYSRL